MAPGTTVVLLRQLVQRTLDDRRIWDGLPLDQKIAVATVLWPSCEFLRNVGADTERGLLALMGSLKPHLSKETCAAILSVRAQRKFAELADLVKSAERRGAKLERMIAPWNAAVRAVLQNDDAYKQLPIDEDLKEAITCLRRARSSWDRSFKRWKVSEELRWRILDLFEEFGSGADLTFARVELAVLSKHGKTQIAMANLLQQVRAKLAKTPTDLSKGPGSELAELLRLLDLVATRMHEEARRVNSLKQFFGGLESRGGRKHGRAKVINGLASIYEELTGTKPTVTYNPETESRDSPFVKFVWDFVSAASLPDWLEGIESAAARSLAKNKKLTKSD